MTKVGLNENELEALRRLGGEPIVQSLDFQPSSRISSSAIGEAISSMPIPDTPHSGVTIKVMRLQYIFTFKQPSHYILAFEHLSQYTFTFKHPSQYILAFEHLSQYTFTFITPITIYMYT